MRLHYLQHVSFETPGYILDWAKENFFEVTSTHFYKEGWALPMQDDFDCLVVMGGPMGVYDQDDYPWLSEEQNFIQEVISAGKPILGICLGAQLIASALSSKVYKGTKEIGWFPVKKISSGTYFDDFSDFQTVLHWHGDTFDLPSGSTLIATNDVTRNQAFELGNVVGLQFHFEMGLENVQSILEHAANDLTDDPYVQTKAQISLENSFYSDNKAVLYSLLNKLFIKK